MDLETAKNDYKLRKLKRHMRFRKCENCLYFVNGFYHNECSVKCKIIEFNINALFCRYYIKGGINNGN